MYLDLCGPLQTSGRLASAAFEPLQYGVGPDREAPVPAFVILEALIQVACRASSAAVFDGVRVIPAKLRDFAVLEPMVVTESALRLEAEIVRAGRLATAVCRLVRDDRDVTARVIVTCAPLPDPEVQVDAARDRQA